MYLPSQVYINIYYIANIRANNEFSVKIIYYMFKKYS